MTPAVKLLIDAGADVNLPDGEGHTALDYAKCDPPAPRKVIKLLEAAGAVSRKPFPPPPEEAARGFAAAARTPAFKEALAEIERLTGIKPAPLQGAEGKIPGGFGFLVAGKGDERAFVEEHHTEMLGRGFYLFSGRDLLRKNGPVIALLPTSDVYRVIAVLETNGQGDTEKLIAGLRELEREQPFRLTGIGADFLEGTFTTPIRDPAALARRINELCADDTELPNQIERLRQSRRFYLWWD